MYICRSEPIGNSEALIIAVFICVPLCTIVTLVSICVFIKYYRNRKRLNRRNTGELKPTKTNYLLNTTNS